MLVIGRWKLDIRGAAGPARLLPYRGHATSVAFLHSRSTHYRTRELHGTAWSADARTDDHDVAVQSVSLPVGADRGGSSGRLRLLVWQQRLQSLSDARSANAQCPMISFQWSLDILH